MTDTEEHSEAFHYCRAVDEALTARGFEVETMLEEPDEHVPAGPTTMTLQLVHAPEPSAVRAIAWVEGDGWTYTLSDDPLDAPEDAEWGVLDVDEDATPSELVEATVELCRAHPEES